MPYYPEEDEEVDYEGVATAKESGADHEFATRYKTGLERGALSTAAASVLGTTLDLADTALSSVGLTDRQDVNNKFLSAIGAPELTGWFNENKASVEVGSGIAGIVVSNWAAGKVLKPGSAAMRAIRGVPYARTIATLDARYDKALRLAQLTNREIATRGMLGVERFSDVGMNLAALGTKGFVTSGATASRAVFRAGLARGLARNVTTEAIMAATLNQNSFLYSDNLAHNIAWSVAGLGLGAGIDNMVSAHTLRKIANSDKIRRINARALDVSGVEAGRLYSMNIVNDLLKAADGTTNPQEFMFASSGATTDRITSTAISAAELRKQRSFTERGKSLFSTREALATPQLKQAFEDLNKVTIRGLSGVSKAGFATRMEGLGAPVKESLERDPTFYFGIEEVGTTVENMTRGQTSAMRDAAVSKRLSKVQEVLANGGTWKRKRNRDNTFVDELVPLTDEARDSLQAEARELQYKASAVPVTMLEPGEWAPIQLGELADNYQPRQVSIEGGLGEGNLKIWSREKAKKGEATLGLSSNGDLYLPGNGRLESLSAEDMLHLYHVGNKAVRDMAAAGHKLTLPKNPTWFQLDLAEQLIRATDESMVTFPGSMTRQSAQVESFAQKVKALRVKEQSYRMANRKGFEGVIDEVKAFEFKVFFNLPRISSYQQGLMGTSESPIDLLLAGLKKGDEVRQMSHAELVKLLNDAKRITGFTDETVDTLDSLHGNSFNFLLDRDGNPIKPIIAYKRPLAPMDWSRDALLSRQVLKQLNLKEALTGAQADPITRTIAEAIMSNPNAAEARKVIELADDQHRSFVPGFRESAPQSATGSLINAVTPKDRRDIDSLLMKAASVVHEDKNRITNSLMREIIETTMGDSITIVNSPRNIETKLLLNQFHSFRQGWDIAREPVKIQLPNGKTGYQFVLDHESAKNITRFERAFGYKPAKGQVLLNPNGTEIVLDELGLDVMKRLQTLHEAQVQMKNTLLRSQGLQEIRVTPWYVPPANTKGKYIGYTFDAQDNVVPDMTIVANSPEELTRMKGELTNSAQWKNGYTFRQRSDIESFMTLWDKAQMDFIAPNTTAIQPNKQNFGRSSGSLLNPLAFEEALVDIRDNMVRHGQDVLEILFDDPIKAGKARAAIARVEAGVGKKTAQHSSIYDRWLQNLLGRNALGAKDSFFGVFAESAEERLNGLLSSPALLKASDTYQALKDFLRVSSPSSPVRGEKFNKLAQSLGQYMPYRTAMEMAERETGIKTPTEVAEITSKLSWFEAASRLRWFESMHAVANIGSLLANTPAIIKALQPMAGETLEQAAKRNGSLVMMRMLPDGEGIAVPNVPKLLWASMRDAWKATPDEFTQRAIQLGYMDQEVAEFERAWNAIDSRDGWRKVVFGDGVTEVKGKMFSAQRVKTSFQKGGLDSWLGMLSDKSEAFTRQWGMYAGRRVAEAMGIKSVDEQLSFAHDLTNKIIANYDPQNRPEIFQGALGAPFGLFQSYVLNYYQRMFRYIETSDARAIATQFAAQGAVFGIGSLPGWDALNWAFFDHRQAEVSDPVDSLYNRFGTELGDLLMHGTISNLPKIFGADGISLYTRGDSQFRMPVNPIGAFTDTIGLTEGGNGAQIPVADTLKRLVNGISQGVQQVRTANGLSLSQTAEILTNMITNRPIAGMLEVGAANGYDTSWDGQVVSQARTTSEQIYRMLGVRAMSQQKEIDNFYASKNMQEEQNARKAALRQATRASIRAGNYDEVPGHFVKYVENGGDVNYYTRWLKSSFESALDTRGERLLERAMKKLDGSQNAAIGRMLDSQVDISEDDTSTDDYGRQEEIDQLLNQQWETNPNPEDSSFFGDRPEDQIEIIE